MKKKIGLVILLLFVISCVVFADKITIKNYTVTSSWKTTERAVKAYIVPDEEEVFNNTAELEQALEEKRQILLALRRFKDVSVTYTLDGNFADVNVILEDAWNIVVAPLGAFNSNYGFETGISAYDQNFLGNLQETSIWINIKQNKHSFRKANLDSRFHFGRIYLTDNIDVSGDISFSYYDTNPFKIHTDSISVS